MLSEDLQKVVDRYLQARKGRSLATLAKDAGIGYTTVRRIAQGEAVANQETVLALVDAALPSDEKVDFLRQHFPRIGTLLQEAWQDRVDQRSVSGDIREFLHSETHSYIFNLAATSNGTTVEQIQRKCGERGLEALDELVEKDVLQRAADGKVSYSSECWAMTNVADILGQVRHSTGFFDKGMIGTPAAVIAHITDSVNAETLEEISRLSREFGKKIIALKDRPESKGHIHFYLDLMMNLYDSSEYTEGEGS